jgi:hypothetical protein
MRGRGPTTRRPRTLTCGWRCPLAAERTERIGLGPAVLVPSVRYPMTNAAAIAAYVPLRPDASPSQSAPASQAGTRSAKSRCDGPTSKRTCARCGAFSRARPVTGKGSPFGHSIRPVLVQPAPVPLLIGADGPKGTAVAEAVGDGIFAAASLTQRPRGGTRFFNSAPSFCRARKCAADAFSTQPVTVSRWRTTRCSRGVAVTRYENVPAVRRGSRGSKRSRPPPATWPRARATSCTSPSRLPAGRQ